MSGETQNPARALLFFCSRQDPADFPGLASIVLPHECRKVEVPCSGRVGVGELMQGLAHGYAVVAVLSCGEKSCVHGFGCSEAKKAMAKARELAETAGVETSRLVFIEADHSVKNAVG